ncbi:WD40-repeat-containing domain [Pseudocohnilembus persalinus]|uniref:WD40-repeat-containing domain n=1 Tax=Pseudocohnilembus persalinus TaxID=266149 RepID=A0A0V0QHL4_PSEPJ|nr:WD40-repeat-containing domain [Pseudocohnilembus persalinus]|eukprot:KRX01594.1 WD40-repeat-containing domain [Pseudocohnilembus persalinus]
MSIKFDPEDTMIAAGCADGTLKIFHLYSGHTKLDIPIAGKNSKDTFPCTCVKWRPSQFSDDIKNVVITGSADGKIQHWHVTDGKELSSIQEENNQINSLDFNQDGKQFVSGGSDNIIRLYDETTQQCTAQFQSIGWQDSGHNNRVFCVKFLQDDQNIIMSGGWDSNVHFWDQRTKKSIKSFFGPKVSGESLDYKNGQILAGSYEAKHQLAIYDYGTCEKVKEILWNPKDTKESGAFVYGCQFSKTSDDTILAGVHGLNQARFFNRQNDYQPIADIEGFKNGIFTVDYGNFSNKFAAAGGDGLLYVGSLTNRPDEN